MYPAFAVSAKRLRHQEARKCQQCAGGYEILAFLSILDLEGILSVDGNENTIQNAPGVVERGHRVDPERL